MQPQFPSTACIWMLKGLPSEDEKLYEKLPSQLSHRIRMLEVEAAYGLLEQGIKPDLIFMAGRPGRAAQHVISEIKTRHPRVSLFVISHWESGDEMARWMSQSVMEAIQPSREFTAIEAANPYELSHREIEVLRLMTKGLIKKEIAETLEISYHTIVNHERSIYNKLNVHTRSAAVAKALMERLC